MQTVSAELVSEQARNSGLQYYRVVELYRRYWNGSAMAWDAAVDISAYVFKVSTAKWKLDRRGFTEWKSPSFQVEVDDRHNFWGKGERTGIWREGLSGTHTYYPELSRVRVRMGQVLPDGTREDLYCFGGLISRPIYPRDGQYQATIYCAGMEEILKRKSAEGLSTAVANELLGSNSGTVFTTDFPGAAAKDFVVKKGSTAGGAAAATVQIPDTDYTLASTDTYQVAAEVTLASALSSGQSAWASYKYWYADKDLSWIVEQLLILAGISSYSVSATNFSGSVGNTWTQSSKADFDAGTLTNIDTDYINGSFRKKWFVFDDFSDGDFTSDPQWLAMNSGSQTNYTGWSVSGGKLVAATPTYGLRASSGKVRGSWEFEAYPSSGYLRVNFCCKVRVIGYTPHWDRMIGYYLKVDSATGIADLRYVSSAGSDTSLGTASVSIGASDYYRVSRDASGVFHVYRNGNNTPIITATENTLGETDNLNLWCLQSTVGATFSNLRWSPSVITPSGGASSTATPVSVSQVLDANGGTAWGSMSYNYAPDSGTITIETWSSDSSTFASGNDPAGYVALSEAGLILSAVKRYLKVRITLNCLAGHNYTTPEVQDYTVTYYTATTTIPLVNLTGMSVYTAIQECAKYPCYEIGFTAAESFFYRSRTTSTAPVLRISSQTNLARELSFGTGEDRVYNSITATFGVYSVKVDSVSKGEAEPSSLTLYGEKQFSISSSLLPKQSANIAESAAGAIYDYTHLPRKNAEVELKSLIQYEIGDAVTYEREHKKGRWKWGDMDRAWGRSSDPDFVWHDDPAAAGWDYTMRIEGIEFDSDPKNPKVRHELVEIL